jgi:glyoxylate reductase
MPATALIAEELRELLDPDPMPGIEVEWLPVAAPTPEGPYGAIVPLLSRRIGRAELDRLPRLRVVANCAVGLDNVDLAACAERGVVVTNTPEVLTQATADLTWALLLAVTRRLKEGQRLIEEGQWRGWDPRQLLGLELTGATLGIVGAGRIGRAVGRRAPPFGLRVCYADPSPRRDFELETGALRLPLDDLLARSDVVSLHVPSTAETRNLIGARELDRMKRGAFLVNTARGDLVDEAALVAALDSGRLAGAGLDVFRAEPRIPPELVRHPRAVVLPHLGSATERTRRGMATLAVNNARAVLAGEKPLTPVIGRAMNGDGRR